MASDPSAACAASPSASSSTKKKKEQVEEEELDDTLRHKNNPNKSKSDRRPVVDCAVSEVPIDEEDLEGAQAKLAAQDAGGLVEPFWVSKYEREHGEYWDRFYGRNQSNFFRDRHYIERLFPELHEREDDEGVVFMEVGCGVGNTMFPLMDDFPKFKFIGCDIAQRAVDLLQEQTRFDPARCRVWQADLVKDEFPADMDSPDFATLIFVLSAVPREHHRTVVQRVFDALKPGGILMMRDYALYDLSQLRFKKGRKMDDRYYVRWDGTMTYFFTTEELDELFTSVGFEVLENAYHRRTITNVKRQLTMKRVWCHIKVRKPTDSES